MDLEVESSGLKVVKVPVRRESVPVLGIREVIILSFKDSDYQPYEEIDRGNVMVTLGDFMKLKPPSFSGAKSTEDPQVFLDEIDKICTALGCFSRGAVELTGFRLTKAMQIWFATLKCCRPSGSTPLIWEEFTQAFMDRFLLESLSRYAPYLVQTERERIKKFIKGLHWPIYRILVSQIFTSYPKVVDVARKIKAKRKEVGVERERSKRNRGEGSSKYKDPSRGKDANIVGQLGRRDGNLLRGHNQEMTHDLIRPNFATAPTKNVKRDKGKRVTSLSQGRSVGLTQQGAFGGGQAKVFTLTPQNAHVLNAVVTGKHYEYMDEPLVVTTPLEESYVTKYVFRSCVVQIKDRDTWVDLVLMITLGFDVILGIDWLVSCYANVDCYCKLVKFKFPGEPLFVIYGHSNHLVNCLMATITREVHNEEGNLEATPVVNEFVDVFPEELLGLPLEREIEFRIDLILETQPISMPPY
ncbi:Uncharacterized protein TCM_027334 [Theobroma cacao]|uniref:Retrotransposon gag domain-containing protein n=1 Tax=Theobroma cacao TaxID=3641 RepID=A0A061G8R8_THECC|nr:Uncharacterized protein TCM_027334 [Theobroma cacao]